MPSLKTARSSENVVRRNYAMDEVMQVNTVTFGKC
jgi:hypothetical protein